MELPGAAILKIAVVAGLAVPVIHSPNLRDTRMAINGNVKRPETRAQHPHFCFSAARDGGNMPSNALPPRRRKTKNKS
jgi:hypothetical protein